MTQAPAAIRRSGAITGRLLGAGLPLGPNVLLTIRGRRTGQSRSVPVAMVAVDGRHWVVGTYGDVQWTRNLRAAGEAELHVGRSVRRVKAVELGPAEAATWFRDVLLPYVQRQPAVWRLFTRILLRSVAPDILTDPEGAALRRPVFELRATMAAKEAP
jgi:deazaflavin-dependent oxidoreductase (nitroreductase family)